MILVLGGLLAYLAVVNLTLPALDIVLVDQNFVGEIATEVLEFQPGSAALGAPEVARALEQSLRVVLEIDKHSR